MTEDEAYFLFRKLAIRSTRLNTARETNMNRGTMVGRYLVVFRNRGVPFYMTPFGTETDYWRDSKTFTTASDARSLIFDLLHARPLTTYDFKQVRGRRKDEGWDRVFLIHIDSARIYVVERESPERWSINDDVPIFSRSQYNDGNESSDRETDRDSESEASSECVSGSVSS